MICRLSYLSANSRPPAAASAEPIANVIVTTRSTLMPISDATRSSNDTARIARPELACGRPGTAARRRARARARARSMSTSRKWTPAIVASDAIGDERRHVLRVRAERPRQRAGVLEQQRHADRGDQHVEPRRLAQRAVREPLDRHAERGAQRHRERSGSTRQSRSPASALRASRTSRAIVNDDPRAEREHVGVREVDEAQDAVDERVAERDQRVERAEREAC